VLLGVRRWHHLRMHCKPNSMIDDDSVRNKTTKSLCNNTKDIRRLHHHLLLLTQKLLKIEHKRFDRHKMTQSLPDAFVAAVACVADRVAFAANIRIDYTEHM
jgi:hypothetical protein